MNLNSIKTLAEILNESSLTRLEVSEGDFRIILEKKDSPSKKIPHIQKAYPHTETRAGKQPMEKEMVDFNNITEIKSPIVGVYYSASSPDSQPFVSIGSKVAKGDVLCIIETMKLMNEITSDRDGEIVDICLKNGDVAEFGQVLFKMM